MQIIPLVASTINLAGLCQVASSVSMDATRSLVSRTDHGKAAEIMKRLCCKELSIRLTIGLEAKRPIVDALRELERFKVVPIKDDWYAIEADFNTWRCLTQSETSKKSVLKEFFCQIFVFLEMLFPDLVMDLIRVPDSDGSLFSLNKRF